MKFITYAENVQQLETIAAALTLRNISTEKCEVIVSLREISRVSETTKDEFYKIISRNQALKLPLVLEWDVLKQDSLFKKNVDLFKSLPLHELKAVRVQDPGALHVIKEQFSWLKVQLILENGNHNLEGLRRWCLYLGDQLDRLVLSNELSKDHLQKYAAELKTSLEVLAFGRILLFYSPRQLLTPLKKDEHLAHAETISRNLEAFGTSEESPHAGFPLIENEHGTFMFNVKDLFLVDHLNELQEMKIGAARFDLRFDNSFKNLDFMLRSFLNETSAEEIQQLKAVNPRPVIKGFYNINKTDVLFSKLKNKRIERQDENYLGEIVDVERDFSLAMIVKSKTKLLSLNDEIRIVTPEGKTKMFAVSEMKNTSGDLLKKAGMNDIVLLPFVRGIVGKSQVYLQSKT